MQPGNQILLWGGGSQARLIDGIIGDQLIGSVNLIFDPVADNSFYSTDIRFVQNIDAAVNRCQNLTDFVVCVGNYAGYARSETSLTLQQLGLRPLSIIHDTAWLDNSVSVGSGLQIMARATIQKFVSIGDWTIVNTGAVIDHECRIGSGVHIMGGAAIAGRVVVGNFACIGTNATVLPDIRIGEGAIIGAGAVVTSDVKPYHVVTGIPARFTRASELQKPAFLEEFQSSWGKVGTVIQGLSPAQCDKGFQ